MHHTKFNLKQLLRQLSIQNDRDYEIQQVAEASGLSRFTVASIMSNSSNRVELRTLDRLQDFFASEGMPITIDQLFTVTTDNPTIESPADTAAEGD